MAATVSLLFYIDAYTLADGSNTLPEYTVKNRRLNSKGKKSIVVIVVAVALIVVFGRLRCVCPIGILATI